jgi:hypothetical protein
MRTHRCPLETRSGSLSKHLAVGPARPELVDGMPLAGTETCKVLSQGATRQGSVTAGEARAVNTTS